MSINRARKQGGAGAAQAEESPVKYEVERDTAGKVTAVRCFASKCNGCYQPKCYEVADTDGLGLKEERRIHPEPDMMGGSTQFIWLFKRRYHSNSVVSITFRESICNSPTPIRSFTLTFRDR